MYVRLCLIAMMDVWLGMIDAMFSNYLYASVCMSIDIIFSMPLIGLRHKTP